MKWKRPFWTSDEDAALVREVVAGKSLNEIAAKIGRTPSAIKNRAQMLRLSFAKLRRRKPNQ